MSETCSDIRQVTISGREGVRRMVEGTSRVRNNRKSILRDKQDRVIPELKTWIILSVSLRQRMRMLSVTKQWTCQESPHVNMRRQTQDIVYTKEVSLEEHKTVIKANDTVVAVIAVSAFFTGGTWSFETVGPYSRGPNSRWIRIHGIVSAMGPAKSKVLLFFCAFTECDVIFVTDEEEDIRDLERIVIFVYIRSSAATNIDEARLDLFSHKQRAQVNSTDTSSF